MKITVDKISSTPSALYLGCVVRGPKEAWTKFATVVVPWGEVPREVVRDMLLASETPAIMLGPSDTPLF